LSLRPGGRANMSLLDCFNSAIFNALCNLVPPPLGHQAAT
jgi:hypothetical protein